jgi:hypothetical protein
MVALPAPRACAICGVPLPPAIGPRRPTCFSPRCEHAFRVQARGTASARRCIFCGAAISAVSPDEACVAPACQRDLAEQRAHAQEEAAAAEARRQEATRLGERHEADLRTRHGDAIPAEVHRALLPANDRPLAPVSPERRAAHAAHLAAIVAEALARPDVAAPPRGTIRNAREPLATSACTGCRGACCHAGGEHAFLTAADFRRHLAAHPDRSAEEVIDAYLAHVPGEAYAGSCVYHGAAGCALPRAMRSEPCNRFFCPGMKQLFDATADAPDVPVLALFAREPGPTVVRAAVIDDGGIALLDEGG